MKRLMPSLILASCWLATPAQSQESRAIFEIEPQELKALREKPLFTPARRPSALPGGSAMVAPRGQAAAAFVLLGVIRDHAGRGLAVLETESGEVIRLAQGESYGRWTLRELGPRHAVLRSEDGALDLALADPAKADSAKTKAGETGGIAPVSPSSKDDVPLMFPAPLVKMP